VPLGILLTRRPALSKPVLGFANIMQTVPSLALFGFLIPLNIYFFHVKIVGGIGARTAIVALVLYSLLPVSGSRYGDDRSTTAFPSHAAGSGVILVGVRVAT
jgi:osmoprotectant transport system permease protein